MALERLPNETILAWAVRVANEEGPYLYHATSFFRYYLLIRKGGLCSDFPKNYDISKENALYFSLDKRFCRGWGGRFDIVVRIESSKLLEHGLLILPDDNIEKALNHRESICGDCDLECDIRDKVKSKSCDLPYVMVVRPDGKRFTIPPEWIEKVDRRSLK